MSTIHPTAVISPGAQLDSSVEVGPYTVIGPQVKIGARTRIVAQAFLDGDTTIGEDCEIFPFASIGSKTQDLKYKGGTPGVVIGNKTVIRESVTVNAATFEGDYTRVGSGCLLMAYSHLGHECDIGDNVIIANCGTLAGHVVVEDQAIVGGLSGIHQFCRVGRMAIIGGCTKITQDVPPYMMADGNPVAVRGINRVGLKRKGVSAEAQKLLKEAYRILYREGLSTSVAVDKVKSEIEASEEITALLGFIEASERGIVHS